MAIVPPDLVTREHFLLPGPALLGTGFEDCGIQATTQDVRAIRQLYLLIPHYTCSTFERKYSKGPARPKSPSWPGKLEAARTTTALTPTPANCQHPNPLMGASTR